MAHNEAPDNVPHGESSVPMGGNIVLDPEDYCAYCGKEFDVQEYDDGQIEVEIPIECEAGKFCCDHCRAQAMYEAQDESGKQVLRRLYLGAALMLEHAYAATKLVWEKWGTSFNDTEVDETMQLLLPEGAIYGKAGVEDDTEAFLLPKATWTIVWSALHEHKKNCSNALRLAETMDPAYLGEDWKQMRIDDARMNLDAADAAYNALSALREVL